MALLSNRTRDDIQTNESTDGAATTVFPARSPTVSGTAKVDERLSAQRRLEAATAASTATRTPPVVGRDSTTEMVLTGPRPRASMLATLSLVLGLGGLLTAFTGVLAGPGVGLGLLATFAAIGGIAATGRRHVAGKSDALLGMALGLAGVVIGTLTLTGNLPWLDTGTDQVMRVRDWLDAQAPWLFPNS